MLSRRRLKVIMASSISLAIGGATGCSFDVVVTEASMAGAEGGQGLGGAPLFGGAPTSGQEPPMGATQPPVGGGGGGDDRCTPGERIPGAQCTICGPDTRYIMPPNDPECPMIDCSELNSFYTETSEDGATLCIQERASAVESNCRTLGNCHLTPNTGCVIEEPVERARVYPGCGFINGCDSTGSPNISRSAQGDLCNGFGTCDAIGGPCSISSACAGLDQAAGGGQQTFCEANELTCQVAVNADFVDNLNDISCLAYCTSGNKACLTAWRSEGGCTKGDPIPCSEARRRVVCECKEPEPDSD